MIADRKFNSNRQFFYLGCDFMKKIIVCLLTMVLLLTQIPTVFAAGSASVKGPGTVRAGDTIEITFTAGGGIYAGEGSVSYDESQLTLKKYTGSLSGDWEVEFNGNKFVFYDNKMATPITGSKTIFKATFTVNKNLTPGTEISVSVKGIKLTGEGSSESSLGTKTYSATIAPPLSGNCNLASMTVSNAQISPAFSTGTTSYTASVPFTTDTLKVSATAEDADAKVTVKNTKLTAGKTTTVTVTVKAANGTTKTYSIKVKRAQDPNYVASSNAALSELSVQEFRLSPAFSPEVKQYYVWLPYEVDTLTLSGKTADSKAELNVPEVTGLEAGKGNDIAVTVTAEDGTEQVYTVTAVRAPAPADTQQFLDPQPTQPEPTEEPTTQPTQEATLPTQTDPVYVAPVKEDSSRQILALACTGALCLVVGILLGMGIVSMTGKKKYRR